MASDESVPIVSAPTPPPRRFVLPAVTGVLLIVLLLASATMLIGLAFLEAMVLGWVAPTNGLSPANLLFTVGSSLFSVFGVVLTINGALVLARSRPVPATPEAEATTRRSHRVMARRR